MNYFTFSIVQSFERIVDALISQENFTNLTIIETGIAFQGLRVRPNDVLIIIIMFYGLLITDREGWIYWHHFHWVINK